MHLFLSNNCSFIKHYPKVENEIENETRHKNSAHKTIAVMNKKTCEGSC